MQPAVFGNFDIIANDRESVKGKQRKNSNIFPIFQESREANFPAQFLTRTW